MNSVGILVDGQNVNKADLRDLLAFYDTTLAAASSELSTHDTEIAEHSAALTSLVQSLNSASVSLANLTSATGTQASEITALQMAGQTSGAQLAQLAASITAAQEAFVSLSAIIAAAGTTGEGVIVGVPYPGLGLFGGAFTASSPFAGSHQSLSGGTGQAYGSPIKVVPYTVSAWVKTTVGSAAQTAVGQAGQLVVGCDVSGHALAQFASASGISSISTATQIADGAWHAVELVVMPSGAILFVDGVAVGTSDIPGHIVSAGFFGVRDYGDTLGATPWLGDIAEVVVWPVAKHTTNYTLQSAPYTGTEGMSVLYHLDGDGSDALKPALPVGSRPAGSSGIRFFLASGDSVAYTVQPIGTDFTGAVPNQVTISGPTTQTHDEPFSPDLMLFVVKVAGAPQCRWVTLPIVDVGSEAGSQPATTTTSDATPVVIATIMIPDHPGGAVNITGFVIARRTDTNEAVSFKVDTIISGIGTSSAAVDEQTVTPFAPPASMAACVVTIGAFGSTIIVSAAGVVSTPIVWGPNLKTMVV